MVILVDVDALWVNPAAVQYDAGELRRADAAMFITAGVVRSTADALSVSVDGSDLVTVKAGSWAIPGNAVAGSGVWRGGIASDVTGTLAARDATNGRIDLVVARQLDTDVVGTHGAYTGRIEIIAGTPSATPGVPALPSMAVELARITVPKSGGGAASVDLSHRTYATGPGGEILSPSFATLPTSAATGQRAYALDTGVSYRWNGTAWDSGQLFATLKKSGTGQTFGSSNAVSQTTFGLAAESSPSSFADAANNRMVAPAAGVYRIVAQVVWDANNSGARNMQLRVNGTSVASDDRAGSGIVYQSEQLYYEGRLNAGDLITLWATQNSGGNLQMHGNDDNRGGTYMTATFVRA